MVYILVLAAAIVGVFVYRLGLKDGLKVVRGEMLKMKRPEFLMTKDEKQEDKKQTEYETKLKEDLDKIFSYEPKFTGSGK